MAEERGTLLTTKHFETRLKNQYDGEESALGGGHELIMVRKEDINLLLTEVTNLRNHLRLKTKESDVSGQFNVGLATMAHNYAEKSIKSQAENRDIKQRMTLLEKLLDEIEKKQ